MGAERSRKGDAWRALAVARGRVQEHPGRSDAPAASRSDDAGLPGGQAAILNQEDP